MRQIILFFIRFRMFLLYILLMAIALILTIQTRSYPKSAFLNSANFISGFFLNTSHSISSYFNLKTENQKLVAENIKLRELLQQVKLNNDTYIDSTTYASTYTFIPANIIRNSYTSSANIVLLNKGKNDSLEIDDGVITPLGLLGIVDKTSGNLSTVISVLNTTIQISAQLKKTNHYGTLSWDGKSEKRVQLSEIPKIAPIQIGDTIITSGRSLIFPKGILIGKVSGFNIDKSTNFYRLQVELFNDMTNIDHVYVIKNNKKDTINTLLNIE